jgi:hypothetical protein
VSVRVVDRLFRASDCPRLCAHSDGFVAQSTDDPILNGFLSQLSGPNKDNAFVQPEYLSETSDLPDEIRGMGDPLPGKKHYRDKPVEF